MRGIDISKVPLHFKTKHAIIKPMKNCIWVPIFFKGKKQQVYTIFRTITYNWNLFVFCNPSLYAFISLKYRRNWWKFRFRQNGCQKKGSRGVKICNPSFSNSLEPKLWIQAKKSILALKSYGSAFSWHIEPHYIPVFVLFHWLLLNTKDIWYVAKWVLHYSMHFTQNKPTELVDLLHVAITNTHKVLLKKIKLL